MATCPTCGQPLNNDEPYCPHCGNEIDDSMAPRADGVGVDSQQPATETDSGFSIRNLDTYEQLVYGGAALTIIGAFLPWASLLGYSVLGIEGDGILTLLAGIIAAGVMWWKPWGRKTQMAIAGLGAITVLIGLMAFTNAAASGLYLTLLGGAVLTVAGGRELIN